MERRLSAELAIFAASAELGWQDAAEGYLVAMEVAADLIGGIHQVVDSFAAKLEAGASFVARDLATFSDATG
jgi:hypothetical protein